MKLRRDLKIKNRIFKHWDADERKDGIAWIAERVGLLHRTFYDCPHCNEEHEAEVYASPDGTIYESRVYSDPCFLAEDFGTHNKHITKFITELTMARAKLRLQNPNFKFIDCTPEIGL